ncbi:hypothetical protein C4K39_5534 [Pseudomonas sessilinigenes]|nr:hypothetical protein C4K39_5534 [Pseudomonas sessilinigenes]
MPEIQARAAAAGHSQAARSVGLPGEKSSLSAKRLPAMAAGFPGMMMHPLIHTQHAPDSCRPRHMPLAMLMVLA